MSPSLCSAPILAGKDTAVPGPSERRLEGAGSPSPRLRNTAMTKHHFTAIAAGSIESGPVPFDLYTKNNQEEIVLCLRKGLGFDEDRKDNLSSPERTFYITTVDGDAYLDYASERLDRIVRNSDIRVNDKAKIVYGVGRRLVDQLVKDPRSGDAVKHSKRYVEDQLALVFSSPEAAANLFAISATDSYMFSHSVNVCTFCILLGRKIYGSQDSKIFELGLAGLLHDIGKSRINHELIEREGDLTPEEEEEMRRHTIYSYEIINEHSLPESIQAAGRSHHERLDGSGYPDGLRGDDIHPIARIVAVADVYDALTSNRPYKPRVPPLSALSEMAANEPFIDDRAFDALLQIVLRNKGLVSHIQNKRLAFRQHHENPKAAAGAEHRRDFAANNQRSEK